MDTTRVTNNEEVVAKAVMDRLSGITYYWWVCEWCDYSWKATHDVSCPKCGGVSVRKV